MEQKPKPNNNMSGQYYRKPNPNGRGKNYSRGYRPRQIDNAQTQIFTKINSGPNQPTHDPNQFYKQPLNLPQPTDIESTRTIPIVKQQQYLYQQNQQKPQPRPIQSQSTKQFPAVRQGQPMPPQPRRQQQTYLQNQNRRPPPNRPPVKGRTQPSRDAAPATLSNIMKAIIYIVSIIVISVFLSIYAIAVGNDVFALVKSDAQLEIIIPDYYTTADVARVLKDKGVINYPGIFRLYAKLRHYSDNYVGGTYTISPSMNYDQLVIQFKVKSNASREEISVVIREGWTVDKIIDYFVSLGMGTREKFIDVIQNYDFDFWFVKELTNLSPDRTYRLEGYLFPDTYFFYTDSNEESIIYRMLSNFNNKFPLSFKKLANDKGWPVDNIIILASMIQGEGKFAHEYGMISSVFWNRLTRRHPDLVFGLLQSDATTAYTFEASRTDRKVTPEDLKVVNPYNTYENVGLPPGPIGNPSFNAICFALEPDETDYFFFVSGQDGRTYFAETKAEHDENVRLYRGY